MIPESELILNEKENVYHLDLAPENISNDIIIVGDPERVKLIASKFDSIEFENSNREFHTITGSYKKKRFTVVSSGIGTDNIDILLNELDALKNIDFQKREIKSNLTSMNIVRIGTSGSLSDTIVPGDVVISKYAIGIDGLLNFYDFDKTDDANLHLKKNLDWDKEFNPPYIVKSNDELFSKLKNGFHEGITFTAHGFYAPQGREIRLKNRKSDYLESIRAYSYNNTSVTNFEMESSGIYGLAQLMGHKACTVCLILAGRTTHKFELDYHDLMDDLIIKVLNRLTSEY
jgi:uridine phosphorylase